MSNKFDDVRLYLYCSDTIGAIMLIDAELGYTPKNLRKLLEESNLSQKQAREIIGKGRNTFSRYLYDVSNHNHVSMAYVDWLTLVKHVSKKE